MVYGKKVLCLVFSTVGFLINFNVVVEGGFIEGLVMARDQRLKS